MEFHPRGHGPESVLTDGRDVKGGHPTPDGHAVDRDRVTQVALVDDVQLHTAIVPQSADTKEHR